MAKNYKVVYFDNYNYESILSKDEFLEMLEDSYTEEEIKEMSYDAKRELYETNCFSLEEYCYEEVIDSLKDFFEGQVFLASGSMGRWDRTCTGIDLMGYSSYFNSYDNFKDFFDNLTQDCDYIKIGITRDNKFFIQCSHHDGTNYVELKTVTPKGISLLHKFFYDEKLQQYKDVELLGKIWNSKVYSEKLPKNFYLE